MKGFNLPDDVSPSCVDAPWNKEEQEEVCTCQNQDDSPYYNQPICPIHGSTKKEDEND